MSKLTAGLPREGLPNVFGVWASLLEQDHAVRTETAAYTATGTDFLVLANAAGGAFTVTLPPAADYKGKILAVKRTSASNNVTIDGNASETIDGSATVTLSSQYAGRLLISDGSNWSVLASI